ncbi:hypothetical protein CONPUDRAFT_157552 [Coniophora puteana RWD-64-598 SS2]|uniref:Up-regulated during septation protein 1 domain-containing protein n=1 Tax=Coniophora puteana (strain RWD-64-598) TaxID=741705 RepID=A0A5M3MEF6_CONPW|nr:uncharacterized protein CONPUDRAFT_157552 [Coniophora puteana RWD-64-598 SS2]EIW77300.1 hypothetical protein CONPUDRAFT_157552 [Coniophora puteana RWD-64-598 SS2]
MSRTFNNLLAVVSAALGLALAIVHPLVTAFGVGAMVLCGKTSKAPPEGANLGEESPSPTETYTTSEFDNLKARLKLAELDERIIATELGATKALNTVLETELAALRPAFKIQADRCRERIRIRDEEVEALREQVYDANERRRNEKAEGDKQRDHTRRVERKLLALSIAWSYSEQSIAALPPPPSLSISPSTDIQALQTALTEANRRVEVQTDRAELSGQVLQDLLHVNEQVCARMEALERVIAELRTGTSKVFSVRDHHAASLLAPVALSSFNSVVNSPRIPSPLISSSSLPIVSMDYTSSSISPSTLIPLAQIAQASSDHDLSSPRIPSLMTSSASLPILPMHSTSAPPLSSNMVTISPSTPALSLSCPSPSCTLSVHSGFSPKAFFSSSASAPHSLLYPSHDPAEIDTAFFDHIHHLDQLVASLESKIQALEYTNQELEGDLGDQLSIAMQLTEVIFSVGQAPAANDEEINIIKRVILKTLDEQELEDVEKHIADRKSLHASPQIILTQPEGGMVRGVDNISRLISTRNYFYSPMSASTTSALVSSDHMAVSKIVSDVDRPIVDGPLLNLWGYDPSPRDLADFSFGVDVHACAGQEKAEEDLPEGSTCVTGDTSSVSLSSDDDDTEYSTDAASSSSSLMSSPTLPFTPLTSSRSTSPPTSPSTPSVTCLDDNEWFLPKEGLEKESLSPAQTSTTSEIDNLKARLKRAELDVRIMVNELGATKASNIVLDTEVATLCSAFKTQAADRLREHIRIQHQEAVALRGQVYDANERRKKALHAVVTAQKVTEGEKAFRIQAEVAVDQQRDEAKRV